VARVAEGGSLERLTDELSVNDLVIKALALAVQRAPEANVSWTEAAMLRHKRSDIGVAVALPFVSDDTAYAELKDALAGSGIEADGERAGDRHHWPSFITASHVEGQKRADDGALAQAV
jgi:hypothetical protein